MYSRIFRAVLAFSVLSNLALCRIGGLEGLIDECECNIDTINNFNNYKIYPQLQNLIRKDYFRYFKVDLSRPCPFWKMDSKCALQDCSVKTCPEDSVPFVIHEKRRGNEKNKKAEVSQENKVRIETSPYNEPKVTLNEHGPSVQPSLIKTPDAGIVVKNTETRGDENDLDGVEPSVPGIQIGISPYFETQASTHSEARNSVNIRKSTTEIKIQPSVSDIITTESSVDQPSGTVETSPYYAPLVTETQDNQKPKIEVSLAVDAGGVLEETIQASSVSEIHYELHATTTQTAGKTINTDDKNEKFESTEEVFQKRKLQEFKNEKHHSYDGDSCESCEESGEYLGRINDTISDESRAEFEHWKKHDDKLKNFCLFDDENSVNAKYVDLLLNPERFTGYAGESAVRVWRSIYEENCFKPPQGSLLNLNQLCLEKRVFYRSISGLHSSINIHLSADYYLPSISKSAALNCGGNQWGPNLDEFESRFAPQFTNDEGPRRLRNLYFVYLLELRAIAKAADYLEKEAPFYTSKQEDTDDVRSSVTKFMTTVREFNGHFNESQMFVGAGIETLKLKEEFRHHFLNISRIMDCVGCDKCRLWGKLQTQGLGTALKILFTIGDHIELSRTEIVTLFNSFSRLSNSISQLDNFTRMQEERERKRIEGNQNGFTNKFAFKSEL